MPKGCITGQITVKDPEGCKKYVERDTPILEGYGGRFIVRSGASEAPGGPMRDRHVAREFPDFDDAGRAFLSPEYPEVATIRPAAANSDIILVEGV